MVKKQYIIFSSNMSNNILKMLNFT